MGAAQNPPVPPATEQRSFSPQSWHYGEPVASHRKPFVFDQNGNLVANFDGWVGRSYEENVANAKLGAAAPDLLEACKAAWNDPSTSREIAVILEAALAKAGVA
jgi:hypothetical protein